MKLHTKTNDQRTSPSLLLVTIIVPLHTRLRSIVLTPWHRLGLPRTLVLALILTFALHRSFSTYKATRSWVNAPIATLARTCPLPAYETMRSSTSDSTSHSESTGKICLTTLTDEQDKSWKQKYFGWRNFDGLLALTWTNKQQYANKHGYFLYDESNQLDKSRPPSWSKIRAVQRLLKEEDCQWVLWLDADTVIMNSDQAIQDFLPREHASQDLLLSADTGGSYNAGVWLVRQSAWSVQFLHEWWNMKSYVKPAGLAKSGDNDALKAKLKAMAATTVTTAEESDTSLFDQHVLAPPRCTFNSYAKFVPPHLYDEAAASITRQAYYMDEAYYHQGDFIAHMAGVDNKVETIKALLEIAT